MKRFRSRICASIAISLLTLFQAEFVTAQTFATQQAEINYEKSQASDAQSFFTNSMAPGMSVPGYSQSGTVTYKDFDKSTQSWSLPGSATVLTSAEQASAGASLSNLKGLENNPGAINAQTGTAIANGSSDAYQSVQKGISESSHPDLSNDPLMAYSKQVENGVQTYGTQTNCNSTTQTKDTPNVNHVPLYKTCMKYAAPPTCTVKRQPVAVLQTGSCTPGDVGSTSTTVSELTYGNTPNITSATITPVCSSQLGDQSFSLYLKGGDLATTTKVVAASVTGATNTWHALITWPWNGTEHHTFSDSHKSGLATLSYQNFVCQHSSVANNDWICSIQFKLHVTDGATTLWAPDVVSPVFNFKRMHEVFTFKEDITYSPPGCNQSNVCQILPDPNYMPPTNPTPLQETSTDTWKCTNVSNNQWVDGVKIDPTDPTLDGIYLPTRIDGPKALFPGDDQSHVCWTAQARNYKCDFVTDVNAGELSNVQLTLANGTTVNSSYSGNLLQQSQQGCDSLQNDPSCSFVSEQVVAQDNQGNPMAYERVYDCGYSSTSSTVTNSTNQTCSSNIPCIGQQCYQAWSENNGDFGQAAAQTSVAGLGSQDMNCADGNPNDCTLFGGKYMQCKQAVAGAVNCCQGGGSSVDIMNGVMVAYKVNSQLGITNSISDAAMTAIQNAPGAQTVAGGWQWVKSGASSLAQAASNSFNAVTTKMSSLFMNTAETQVETETGASAASMTSVTGAQSLVAATINQVGQWTLNTFGPTVTQLFFTQGASGGLSLGGEVGTALAWVGYAYLAYQVAMIILQSVYKCESSEQQYVMKRQGYMCTKPITYCAQNSPFGCIEEETGACCFHTPLARILQEQAVKLGARPSFGNPPSMDCSGLTVTELNNMDWSKVDLSEWYHLLELTKQVPTSSTTADQFFSQSNISRGTILSQSDIAAEQKRRADINAAAQQNAATKQSELASYQQQMTDNQAQQAQLQTQITQLQSVSPPDTTLISAKQQQLATLQQEATTLQAEINTVQGQITQYQNDHVPAFSYDANQTTVLGRVQERLKPDSQQSLSQVKNNYRDTMWNAK